MRLKKVLFIILGCIGLGLGAVGTVLPILPTFPFLLLAAFCFAKSSEKLHNWFINTKLYKNNLESYVKGKGMTWKTKIRIMVTVTLLMSIGFIMMIRKDLYIPCAILAGVWLFHIVYFIFVVKTTNPLETADLCDVLYIVSRKLQVEGLKNKEAAHMLEQAFENNGHMKANADYRSGIVTVHMDTELSDVFLIQIVKEAGYKVTQIWKPEANKID